MNDLKYSDLLADWLVELGYTHCFFVAGGNIMHLLDSCRKRFTCVPTVHEVAAGIATEYFNESEPEGRAFSLVTAGPGVSNILTAMAGAWLENRELLVIAGQVKSSDLAGPLLRQRGIQEIDGTAISAPVSVRSIRVERPAPREEIVHAVLEGRTPRKGPVFIEVCLDAQGAPVTSGGLGEEGAASLTAAKGIPTVSDEEAARIGELLANSARPILLIGGGVSREAASAALPGLRRRRIPMMTTWNGHDRVGSDEPAYFGRPNTWGQRSANLILQQSDLIVALGTRLGLQQTGFNWRAFAPGAKIVQVDIASEELEKGHPVPDVALAADANDVIKRISDGEPLEVEEWIDFARMVRSELPLADPENQHREGFLDPFEFFIELGGVADPADIVIPCSSGGANTAFQQAFAQKEGQIVIGDKALASMGYGLAGAIGASFAWPERRVIHTEGDGGFAQNLQELGTVSVNSLPIKMFIHSNDGYASIRMTQSNYFDGAYLGCDSNTGLGFPDWKALFAAYSIPCMSLADGWRDSTEFQELFAAEGPAAFIVPIDPEQTYFPKISSRVTEDGSMESAPLHLMSPDLEPATYERVAPYLSDSAD